MKNSLLLPSKFKSLGFIIICIGANWSLFENSDSAFYTLSSTITIIGGLILMFSKEKCEDEFIAQLRLRAFFLATLFTCIVVLILNLLGFIFNFSLAINISLPIIILQAFYICVFYFLIKKYSSFKAS